MPKKASYLLDEEIIPFYPTLAKMIGVNKAIMMQQLHFLLNGQKIAKNANNYVDGAWWVYNSYKEWQSDHFIWLSVSAIKNLFLDLEADGFVISRQSVKYASDRRKWYRIDYEAWEKFAEGIGQNLSHQSSDTIYPINGQNVDDGYSTTSTDTDNKETTFAAKNAAGVLNFSVKGNGNGEPPKTPKTKTKTPNPPTAAASPLSPAEKDALFDAVVLHVFNIGSPEELKAAQESNNEGTRAGMISNWLAQGTGTFKGKRVGKISGPATPEHVRKFAAWYKSKNKNISMPLDGEKFVDAWREWASTMRKRQQPRPAPPAQPTVTYTQEQIEQRQRDLRAAKQGMGS